MAKVITPKSGDKYYSPVTYSQFCLSSSNEGLDTFIVDQIHDIIDRVYPIGSYYISATATSPADLFNYGTWELLESGRTILGAGAAYDISTWETKTLADGSKWAKIYYQDANTAWASAVETDTIYDRLSQLNKFYSSDSGDSGYLELMLEYESLGSKGRWKQRAYPLSWTASTTTTTDMISGRSNYTATSVEEGCYLPSEWSTFRGLGVSNHSSAKISGQPGESVRWYGLRNTVKNTTYVPEADNQWETISVTLWVRYDNVIAWGVEAGATGGNATITLTTGQIPSHRHGIGRTADMLAGGVDDAGRSSGTYFRATTATGSSGSHNNLQPYTNVFVWKRVEDSTNDAEETETIEGLEV